MQSQICIGAPDHSQPTYPGKMVKKLYLNSALTQIAYCVYDWLNYSTLPEHEQWIHPEPADNERHELQNHLVVTLS